MNRIALTLIVLIALGSPAAFAQAASSPKAYLQSMNEKLDKLSTDAKKNEKKIVKLFNDMMDFEAICKDALGKHWDQRSKAEQKEFVSTLHSLIENNLVKKIDSNLDTKIEYTDETLQDGLATVVTIVTLGDGPRAEQTEVSYKLIKKGPRWVVVDMITDGISLVGNYRSQFNKIISKDGWDTLMQKMRDKLSKA